MNKVVRSSFLLSLFFVTASVSTGARDQVSGTSESNEILRVANKNVTLQSQRFVVGVGATANCITDKRTGLMWPKNGVIGFEATEGEIPIAQPDYANTNPDLNVMTWSQALIAIKNMNRAPARLCGYSDWRLPNKLELKSMINYGVNNAATWLNLPAQGFINMQVGNYWSFSTYASDMSLACFVSFNSGDVGATFKFVSNYVWPVRSVH